MSKPSVSNVLAERYASAALCDIWSPEGKIKLERDFWIAVMKGQRDLGLDIPAEAIDAYTAARDSIDLADIAEREAITRHDVKARIESYNAAAGHEHIHKGMTSRRYATNRLRPAQFPCHPPRFRACTRHARTRPSYLHEYGHRTGLPKFKTPLWNGHY